MSQTLPMPRSLAAEHADAEDLDTFIAGLTAAALRHRAVDHPYLSALASGNLPDPIWALRDFAAHYVGYSSHFPRYLTATISRLGDPVHRLALIENLTEESGIYPEDELEELAANGIERAWIDGIPHPDLFHRFCEALDVDPDPDASLQVICWREMFLDILCGGSAAQAIGGLGLGTESIVSTIYQAFLPAIERAGLAPRDAVFFPLHATVDDHHQATLLDISRDLARTEHGRRELEKGMHKALALRAGFWDILLERALRANDPAYLVQGDAA